MKIPIAMALAGLMITSVASAETLFMSGLCGTIDAAGSGSFTCPSYASFGVPEADALEFLVEDSNYALGVGGAGSLVTTFTYTGAMLAFASDTVTSTGMAGFGGYPASQYLGFLNPPAPSVSAPAGFYDNSYGSFGTVTVNYTATANAATQGIAGYVEVVYGYNFVQLPPPATPEPASAALCLAGTAGVAIFKRKRFARK